MVNLEIIQFLKKISDDPELYAKLGNNPGPEQIVKAAFEAGHSFTEEEYRKTSEVIKSILKMMDRKEDGELSEDNLDTVIGGVGPNLLIPMLENVNSDILKILLGM